MSTVLILNHRQRQCGVHQFGRRVYDLASASGRVRYFYREAETEQEYQKVLAGLGRVDYIIYNWHRGTMPWLTEAMIEADHAHKHFFVWHEAYTRQNYDGYLFFGCNDQPGIDKSKSFVLPRPLLEYRGEAHPAGDVPTIGSFGFGFHNKNFPALVSMVNDQFSRARIRLHMPHSFYGDPTDSQTKEVIRRCIKANRKKTIQLDISRQFLSNDGLLDFLAGNDLNAFLYSENGEGLSSCLDYALSVRRPIAVNNCRMFRHVARPEMMVESHSLWEIATQGIEPLKQYYSDWSTGQFVQAMENVFLSEVL